MATFVIRLQHVLTLLAFAFMPLWLRIQLPDWPLPWYPLRSVIVLLMLAALIAWGAARFSGFATVRRDPLRRWFALLTLALALWAFASTQWAFINFRAPAVAISASVQFGIIALFVVMVLSGAITPRRVIAAWGIGLIGVAALTIAQAANQGSIGLTALGEFPIALGVGSPSIVRAGDITYVRPYGLLPHPNVLAGALALGLLALTGWLVSSGVRRGWLAGIALPVGLFALLLTFSRGAWIALAAGALAALPWIWPALRRARWRVGAATIALGAAGALFVALYAPLVIARAGVGEEGVELRSVADRIVYTDFAVRAIRERPIGGVGIGNFPWRTSYYLLETFYDLRGDNVHNVLLSAGAELGIVGAGVMIAAHGVGAIAAVRGLRAAGGDERAARAVLLGAWAALIVIGLVDHYPWTFPQFQLAWWGALAVLAVPPDKELMR